MLVLTRKANEKIRLGDDITITVVKISNGSIRLGIDAPRNVRILRSEIEAFDDAAAKGAKAESGEAPAATTPEQADTGESGAEGQVYQLRGSIKDGRLEFEQAAPADHEALRRDGERVEGRQQPAPLARFLPPLPPAVGESTANYQF